LLAAAASIVLLVALFAGYAPSRRVRRLDPNVALRVE
jgi:ABC-type antimicrobial peptide transport system permease subunit